MNIGVQWQVGAADKAAILPGTVKPHQLLVLDVPRDHSPGWVTRRDVAWWKPPGRPRIKSGAGSGERFSGGCKPGGWRAWEPDPQRMSAAPKCIPVG